MLIWKPDCFFYKSYPSLPAQSEMSPISYVHHSVIAAIQKDWRVDCSGGMELISATSAASLAHLVLELYRWNEIIVGHVEPLLWLWQQWQIYVQFNNGRPCHWICLWQHKEMGLEWRIRKSTSSIMLFLEQLALSRQGAVCSKHWMAVMNSSSIRDRGVFLHGKKRKPMSVQEAVTLDLLSHVWVLLSSIFTFSGTLRGHNRGFLSKSPLPKTPADKSCQALFCWKAKLISNSRSTVFLLEREWSQSDANTFFFPPLIDFNNYFGFGLGKSNVRHIGLLRFKAALAR